MERLTEILNNLKKGISQMGDKEEIKVNKNFLKYVREYLEQLKFYKNAEEQGLILRLPCKVGDTVWYIDDDDDDYPLELLVTKIDVEENGYLRYHAREKDNCGKIGFIKDDIGKTVFLTKEEAEQVLKQMGEREDE